MPRAPGRLLGPLGRRLFAAFILTAVGAVGLVALLAVVSARQQTDALAAGQQARQRQAIVDALSDAYARAGTWPAADLTGVQALAHASGIGVVVLDTGGGQVATISGDRHDAGDSHAPHPQTSAGAVPGHDDTHDRPTAAATSASTAAGIPSAASSAVSTPIPILVAGHRVGTVLLDLSPAAALPARQARTAVLHTVAAATGLAVLLAAAAALLVSWRISRPLAGLAAAAQAVQRGAPDAAGLLRPGPGELGQVSRAFAAMSRALVREDELRRTVMADVAHELRTPVTILRGQTEQLLDGLAEPSTERLASLHAEILRLDHLVDDLATLSAAQAAGLRLDRTRLDLGQVVMQAVTAMRPQFDDADLTVGLHTQPVAVLGDADRLAQVTTNLLTNAVKFTPPGGAVTVSLDRRGQYAVLTVTDTGPGICASELPYVFDRFWRGAAATGRAGTGIGLAVVAELVAAHQGTVTADSPPGGGARFTVALPTR